MNKKITILYIDIEGGFGGSSISLCNMVLSLNLETFKPIVFCKKRGPTVDKLLKYGIDCQIEPTITSIIPLKKNNLKNYIANSYKLLLMKGLVKKIVNLNPDILHLNYEGLVPLHYILKRNKFSGKTVLHFRSSLAPPNFIYKFYAKHINKNIDFLIFIVEINRNIALEAGVNLEKNNHKIIYNPVNSISNFKKKNLEKKSVLKVVFLALLDRHKGSYRLLEIAEILRQLKSNVKIDVYGGSPNKSKNIFWKKNIIEELRKEVSYKGLAKWIKFHGHTYSPEKILSNADVLIHPSFSNDPWGRNVIEALSMGIPVISHGNYDIFVKNNFTGLLFKEWNAMSYGKALDELSKDKKPLEYWSLNAIEFAKKNFSKELYGQSIENVYNNILSINKDSKGNNEKKL